MFSIFQTRTVFVLVLIITFLISFIGLNLKKNKYETVSVSSRLKIPQEMVNLPVEEKEDSGELDIAEDEGTTIVLD